MKILLVLGVAGLALLTAGCGSVNSVGSNFRAGLQEKFQGPVYRSQVVEADRRAAYEAAREAVRAMGFRITRGGAAQGVIEALSGLATSDSLDSTRQRGIYIMLANAPEGTEVSLRVTEIIEDSFRKGPGLGTENTLRDTPLYEVFFRHLEQALATAAAEEDV